MSKGSVKYRVHVKGSGWLGWITGYNINNSATGYAGNGKPIDAIEAWQLPYHLGNVVKYVSRAGHKDKSKTLEDLKKANWYLSRYIANLEQEEK